MSNITKDKFIRVENSISDQEKLSTENLTFFQDAFRRIRTNKVSMISMYFLLFIVVMAIVGPYFNQHSYKSTVYEIQDEYIELINTSVGGDEIEALDEEISVLNDIVYDPDNGLTAEELTELREELKDLRAEKKDLQVIKKEVDQRLTDYKLDYIKLPPRIKGLENLGIFDGTVKRSIPEYALANYEEDEYKLLDTYHNEEYDETYVTIKEYLYVINGADDHYYTFGTDDLGRDTFTRLWFGARISLYIGLLAAVIDMSIGVTYGMVAGFFGKRVDLVMMRIVEVIANIPALVILMILLVLLKPGLVSLSLAIGLTGWTGVARVVRAQVLKLKNQEFILAARTLGASNQRMIAKHIFPNVIGQIIVMATFSIPGAIFYEAFLSFIGLGLPAPMASLGVLINDGREFLHTYPHMIIIPIILITFLILSINLLANGLRDALDPKMRKN